MTTLIVAGGKLNSAEIIKNKIKDINFDLVIACDSGYDNLQKLNIKADILIGDFDSISSVQNAIKKITLKAEKDDTDLKVCVNYALQQRCQDIIILCSTGGRIDHLLSNLSILQCAKNAKIIDEQNEIICIKPGEYKFYNTYKYISFIPITNSIILSSNNLKYEMKKTKIYRDNIISISNESLKDEFFISLESGHAYMIFSND